MVEIGIRGRWFPPTSAEQWRSRTRLFSVPSSSSTSPDDPIEVEMTPDEEPILDGSTLKELLRLD